MSGPSTAPEAAPERATQAQGVGIRSIGVRVAVPMVLLVIVIAVMAFIAQTERERRSLLAAKDVAGRMVVRVMASAAVAPLEFDDAETMAEELEYVRGDDEVVAAAVWALSDGELDPKPVASFSKGEAGIPPPPTVHPETESQIHETIASFSRPVIDGQGEVIGMAQVDLSLEREMATLATSEQLILRTSVGVGLAVTVLLLGLFRVMVIRPLNELMRAARRVERGQRGRVDEARRDEFGRVAHAFNHMVAAIEDRERKIAANNAQLTRLFDNMRQAIFSVGPDRRVRGQASRAAQELFGREIAGASLDEILLEQLPPGAPEQEAFELWLDAVFRGGVDLWADMESLAPDKLHLRPGWEDEAYLAFEFRPIVEDGELRELMVLVTDETERRRLEQDARELESRYEREMTSMRKILAGGTQLFVDFLRSVGQRTRRCESIVGDTPRDLRRGEIDELFRHGHTIKGEARTFELLDLRDAAERFEDALSKARSTFDKGERPDAERLHEELWRALSEMRTAFDTTRDRFVEASPLGEAVLDQTTVSRRDLEELLVHARDAKLPGAREMTLLVERLASRPLAEAMLGLVDSVPTWAERAGKRAKLVLEGGDVRVPGRLAETLPAVLTHLVRNSISHGIETPQARDDAGKDPLGRIHVRCEPNEASDVLAVELWVSDDGRGLDHEGLTSKASGSGPRPEELAFEEGLTTSSGDELSGRGVGLGAVRRDLEAIGYAIDFVPTQGPGVTLHIRPKGGEKLP